MTLTFGVSSTSLGIKNILNRTNAQMEKSLQRISTGYKVNSAADGAADMAIVTTLEAQIRGFGVASSNIQQGLGMLNIADSGLQQITEHLLNLRDIAVAANNSTNTAATWSSYQSQVVAEIATINSLAANTKFDANVLLNGTVSGGAAFNIMFGPNSGDTLDIKTAFSDNTAATLTVAQSTIASAANAATLLGQVDAALVTVGTNLATIGGFQNRLTSILSNVEIAETNFTASQSSIRHTDVAKETANVTRLQILQSAAAYALAQANTTPALALSLLPR